MLGASDYIVNSLWDSVFLGIPFVVNQVYIGFHSGDPGSGGTSAVLAIPRQSAIFERDADGHWRTAGAPMEVAVDIPDAAVTHISLHDAFDDGNWLVNMIANQPIPVVEGDLMIASDLIQWSVTDWVA